MQNESTLKLNDIPFGSWLLGFGFIGTGIFFFTSQGFSGNTILFGAIGLVLLLLTWGLTIKADKNTRTLRLEYWSLYFLRRAKEIPFDDIAAIRINSTHTGTRQNRNNRSYRIEAILKDESIVPFRTAYNGGSFRKQKIVDQLRAFISLPESFDESPVGMFRAATKAGAMQAAQTQEALTGSNAEEHVTSGVHWQLQSVGMGAAPVTRWFSPDFKMRDGFLFIAQKVAGQGSGGLLASLGNTLFKQSISLYGFKPEDTPGLAQADTLASPPPLIDFHFTGFTSNQAEARQILNPWIQNPLAEWGQKYPLKQFQSGGRFSQLIVMFSPNGVYLCTLGNLQPDQVDELTALGVEMVKSSGM